MPKVIFSAPAYDIEVTASKNYKGITNYVVRYGLQVNVVGSLEQAYQEFNNSLHHALACEGVEL